MMCRKVEIMNNASPVIIAPPEPLTRLGQAAVQRLEESRAPIVTPYQFFQILRQIYATGEKLYLRNAVPTHADLRKVTSNLLGANKLAHDPDYGRRAYRILSNSDSDAEDICCLVDPFCHISHLSALQRYGLTDRRPEALHLTTPASDTARALIHTSVLKNYGPEAEAQDHKTVLKPVSTKHPEKVRNRKLHVLSTRHLGHAQPLRGSFARITTIGQTFADTIEEPSLCGGMPHILDIWREHAPLYLEEIIAAINHTKTAITKVRAGYILDEMLGFVDIRIEAWRSLARRGGSQVLDPAKPFAPTYSEKWMLSINV